MWLQTKLNSTQFYFHYKYCLLSVIILYLNSKILGIIDDFVNNNILFLMNITTGNKIQIYNDLSVTVILWVKYKY